MGVGTTCLGAKELNRKFIGIEKEVKYYNLAVERVFPITQSIYKNIQTKENYDKLLSSGMFWEFHPELSGKWLHWSRCCAWIKAQIGPVHL